MTWCWRRAAVLGWARGNLRVSEPLELRGILSVIYHHGRGRDNRYPKRYAIRVLPGACRWAGRIVSAPCQDAGSLDLATVEAAAGLRPEEAERLRREAQDEVLAELKGEVRLVGGPLVAVGR
jgi:hypothetical protein